MKFTGKDPHKQFPKNKLGRLSSISVKTNSGSQVDIKYGDLQLTLVNNQLCLYYCYKLDGTPSDSDLYMPLIRIGELKGELE